MARTRKSRTGFMPANSGYGVHRTTGSCLLRSAMDPILRGRKGPWNAPSCSMR